MTVGVKAFDGHPSHGLISRLVFTFMAGEMGVYYLIRKSE